MAYDVNFTAPKNKLNVKSLPDYIWYHYSSMSVSVVSGLMLIMILACVAWGRLIQQNEEICGLKCMLRRVYRGNLSKHSERFERTLGVKIWQPARL